MKKITIITRFEIEEEDGEERLLRVNTSHSFDGESPSRDSAPRNPLYSIFEIHQEKVEAIERKLID